MIRHLPETFGQDTRAILEQSYVHIDETPILVGIGQKRKGKCYKQGYFWPLLHPEVGVSFHYQQGRSFEAAKAILGTEARTLISDAYDVYESYVRRYQCRWQLCWMHIRRNFIDAEKSNPERAQEALEYIRALYRVEGEIKRRKLKEPEQIAAIRFVHSEPILIEFKQWLTKTAATPEAITSDSLSQAISYVYTRWDAAVLFVRDGNLPMDNGEAERKIKPVKVGIKNFLFFASEVGADAAAVFYTLIASAMMLGIHPYYYLLDLTQRIDQPGLTARDLIPVNWKKLFYEQAVPEHLRAPPP